MMGTNNFTKFNLTLNLTFLFNRQSVGDKVYRLKENNPDRILRS